MCIDWQGVSKATVTSEIKLLRAVKRQMLHIVFSSDQYSRGKPKMS